MGNCLFPTLSQSGTYRGLMTSGRSLTSPTNISQINFRRILLESVLPPASRPFTLRVKLPPPPFLQNIPVFRSFGIPSFGCSAVQGRSVLAPPGAFLDMVLPLSIACIRLFPSYLLKVMPSFLAERISSLQAASGRVFL